MTNKESSGLKEILFTAGGAIFGAGTAALGVYNPELDQYLVVGAGVGAALGVCAADYKINPRNIYRGLAAAVIGAGSVLTGNYVGGINLRPIDVSYEQTPQEELIRVKRKEIESRINYKSSPETQPSQ